MREAANEVFNVGFGAATDVITVAKTLLKKYDKQEPLAITGNYRLGDIRHNYADISKIKSMLGFIPKINFEAGITAFTAWVNGQEVQASRFEDSIHEMKMKGLFK